MRKMPTYRLTSTEWDDLSDLAGAIDGLAIVLDLDCVDMIIPRILKEQARGGVARALKLLSSQLQFRLDEIEPSHIRNPQ